jgi:DNA polymerase elongation subunit (family B)
MGHSNDMYRHGKKFIVEEMNGDNFKVSIDISELKGKKFRWCLAKDDVTPQDIFRLTNEGPDERAIIAKYCFQDCNLVHNLMKKNDILTGMSEIANICYVPISFIIMRGQGIKLLSFIAKKCSEKNTLMPVLDMDRGDSSYEGAICLKPKCGLYIDNPVAVVDYASLYPSSMISENISHDSKVWSKEYDLNGDIVIDLSGNKAIYGKRDRDGKFIYDNLPEYEYVDITYDRYIWRRKGKGKAQEKVKVGTKTCRFAQFPDGKKAIMPSVLHELLAGRKATRKFIKYKTITTKTGEQFSGLLKKTDTKYLMTGEKENKEYLIDDVETVEDTYNDFMKNVFDKRQQGLKVTANSLYGQCGARTSSFYEIDIAASTTATGRKLLIYGKKIIEGIYGDKICDTKYGKIRCKAAVVYGDTDSAFVTFSPHKLDGTKIVGKEALDITIQLAIECGELASKFLKPPHDLEYEKTFDPFLLLSKKRYVGMLYETDINKCKRKSMGIVLKRRDNAPVVKDIYGGIIDIIMKEQDIEKAVLFTKQFLRDIISEKIGMEKLIITKSLRGFYKCPESIAHKVLADRMGKRDSGNKPSNGSRIPYIFIQTKGNVKLQGDRIESPDYIKKNKLKPDYKIYITNQIMKPVTQIFSLVLEQMKDFKKKRKPFERKVRSLQRKWKDNEKKCDDYIMKERDAHVKKLIFDDVLRVYDNNKNGQHTIQSMFGI